MRDHEEDFPMRALTGQGQEQVGVETVPDPAIQELDPAAGRAGEEGA